MSSLAVRVAAEAPLEERERLRRHVEHVLARLSLALEEPAAHDHAGHVAMRAREALARHDRQLAHHRRHHLDHVLRGLPARAAHVALADHAPARRHVHPGRHRDARAHVRHRVRSEITERRRVVALPSPVAPSREHRVEASQRRDVVAHREQPVVAAALAPPEVREPLHPLRHHVGARRVDARERPGELELDPQPLAVTQRRRRPHDDRARRLLRDAAAHAARAHAAHEPHERRRARRLHRVRVEAQHDLRERRALAVGHDHALAEREARRGRIDIERELVEREILERAHAGCARERRAPRRARAAAALARARAQPGEQRRDVVPRDRRRRARARAAARRLLRPRAVRQPQRAREEQPREPSRASRARRAPHDALARAASSGPPSAPRAIPHACATPSRYTSQRASASLIAPTTLSRAPGAT